MTKLLMIAVCGLAAQLVDGSLGMAYGVTSTTLLLACGLAPAVASASVHLAEVGTTLMAGTAHWKFGNVDWRTVGLLGVPGAVGAFVGAYVLTSLSAAAAKPVVSMILLALGLYVLVRFAFNTRRPAIEARPLPKKMLAPLGLFAGFLDAVGGGGWGPVSTPTLMVSGRMEPRKVIGSVDASEFLVAVSASAGFLLSLGTQSIPFPIVGALLVGGIIAAPLAAWIVQKMHPRLMGALVGTVVLVTNARTLLMATSASSVVTWATYGAVCLVAILAIGFALAAIQRDGLKTVVAEPNEGSTNNVLVEA